jgi:hypothetical protein
VNILLLNQDWFATELRTLGHTVRTCGTALHLDVVLNLPLNHLEKVLAEDLNGFAPDIIIWLDDSAPLMLCGLEDATVPVVYYSVDSHHHHEMHGRLAAAFDHVLVAQRDYLPCFAESGTPCEWFPLWAPRYVEASQEKRYDLTFIGNLNRELNPARVEFFEQLQARHPIHLGHGAYWDFFPFAHIVVNQTVKGDLNFRVFEALMCGATLLTERTPNGLLDLFNDGEHLVTYERSDADAAAAQARELLENPARMRAIAAAGRAEVLARHTPLARAHRLDQLIRTVQKRPRDPRRHFAVMINFGFVSTVTESTSALVSALAAQAGLDSARRALSEGAQPSDNDVVHIVRLTTNYDRLTRGSLGAELLREFAAAYPEKHLLTLADLRQRLNRGELPEARRLAAQISSQPADLVFHAAEQIVSSVLHNTRHRERRTA